MISPSDEAAAAPPRAPTGALAAVAFGSALGSVWLAATGSAHLELPFGAHGGWWRGIVAGALLLAALSRAFATGAARALLAALLAAVTAATAIAFAAGAEWLALPLALLSAIGSLGLLPGGLPSVATAVVAAALVLGAWAGVDRHAAVPTLVALTVGSTALALALAVYVPPRAVVGASAWAIPRWLRSAALALGVAMVAVAPAAWFGIDATGARWALAIPALACGVAVLGDQLAVAGIAAIVWLVVGRPADAPAQVVATAGAAAVHYQRATQQLELIDAGIVVDVVGPDRAESPLLATLVRAFARPGDRIGLLGVGAGRVHAALAGCADLELDAIDWRPDAQSLRPLLLGDGPVVARDSAAPPVRRFLGPTAALAAWEPASRQALVLGEPVGPAVPCTVSVQRAMRRVVGDGLVLQAAALDRVAPARLQQWFAAAAAAHPWNGLFVVGDAAVLVSAVRPPMVATPFAHWDEAARWGAHAAHLGDAEDVQLALLGTLQVPTEPLDIEAGAVGRPAVLPVLHAWLRPAVPAGAVGSGSLLTHWTNQQAELRRQLGVLRGLDGSPAARDTAQAIALRFLPQGAPHALLQAALGVAGSEAGAVLAPASASRRAFALDPTCFAALPPVCAGLPQVQQSHSELEDLAVLPPAARLAAVCSEDTPFAVALRARFPSRCARALVAQLATGPLPLAGVAALRELADPFVLQEAVRAVQPRGGERELLGLWRYDLPAPAGLAALTSRSGDERTALAAALRGRRHPSCRPLLAALLEADELAVREVAGQVLHEAEGGAVPFDPRWPQSARHEAAERLRSLHNRAP